MGTLKKDVSEEMVTKVGMKKIPPLLKLNI